jgi:hypothetical protein
MIYESLADKDIQFTYKNNVLKSLTSTKIWIWNGGKLPIIASDLQPNSALVIELNEEDNKNIQILEYDILKITNDDIKINFDKIEQTKLSIKLNFLNFNDGVLINVKHTGTFGTTVKIIGTIVGDEDSALQNIKRISGHFKPTSSLTEFDFWMFGVVMGFLPLIFGIGILVDIILKFSIFNIFEIAGAIFLIILGGIFSYMSISECFPDSDSDIIPEKLRL